MTKEAKEEVQEQPQQVSRIDKMVKRLKKPMVLNEDIGVITEDTRSLGICSGCDTREICSHVDRNERRFCGTCADKLMGVVKPKEKQSTKKYEINTPRNQEEFDREEECLLNYPISNQIDMTVILQGKVYDLIVRDEICDHSNQKFVDSMKHTKSNFCCDCGKIMNYRKPKKEQKPKKLKEKQK